ncbi:MAG: hypothetical protein JWP97_4080 [Labilithrix sp.]|nr:hypothetical protein [Labilithrix sp.]
MCSHPTSAVTCDLLELRLMYPASMTALWRKGSDGWQVMAPTQFPDEETLHRLVEQDPYLLPLAGSPRIAVVGREVRLGTGYADLVAVEEEGRLVVIEIKLARNAEARRAVVAQVLAYASELQRLTLENVEAEALADHLRKRGFTSLFGAMSKLDQEGAMDEEAFQSNLVSSLAEGRFRLVLVLDAAPPELVRIASYLQRVAEGRITLDLITMTSYTIASTQVLVPQRVDGEPPAVETVGRPAPKTVKKGELTEGAAVFEASIASAPASEQPRLQELVSWARALEREGLVSLESYRGASRWILLPRLIAEGAGLVSIWNERGAALQLWRSVFERSAPELIAPVEASIGGPIKQGGNAKTWNAETLALLTRAYRQATRGSGGTPA